MEYKGFTYTPAPKTAWDNLSMLKAKLDFLMQILSADRMKKLYLDVDGVLLTTKNKRMADNVASFVSYIVENFDCYWLTTHCRDGNTRNVLNVLSHYLPNNIILQLQAVKPTVWDSMKT